MNAPAPARVALNALSLTDLRNYASLQLFFAAPLLVLTGPNGAGKTNLLEGISLLTPGRGLRRAAFDEISRHGGAGGWAVAAIAHAPPLPYRLMSSNAARRSPRPGVSNEIASSRLVLPAPFGPVSTTICASGATLAAR